MFVTFSDTSNPKTIVSLMEMDWDDNNPKKYVINNDYFKKYLGDGVSLKSVSIEMTDGDVTTLIDRELPWLNNLNGGYLHGGFTSRNAPLGLSGRSFKQGDRYE